MVLGSKDYEMWIRGQVTLEEPNPGFVVIFEAYPFRDYSVGSNMIALDDINVVDGGICAMKRKSTEAFSSKTRTVQTRCP